MSDIKANFKTDSTKYFKYYVQLLNPLLKLTTREVDVLSTILLVYYTNISHPKIDDLIFSTSSKKAIREKLKLSEPSLNNSFTILRKKGIIVGNKLSPIILKFPKNNKLTITYELELQ